MDVIPCRKPCLFRAPFETFLGFFSIKAGFHIALQPLSQRSLSQWSLRFLKSGFLMIAAVAERLFFFRDWSDRTDHIETSLTCPKCRYSISTSLFLKCLTMQSISALKICHLFYRILPKNSSWSTVSLNSSWKIAVQSVFVNKGPNEIMNIWSSYIWTAEWRNKCKEDPRSY